VPISAHHMELRRGLVARPQHACVNSAAVKMPFLRWGHVHVQDTWWCASTPPRARGRALCVKFDVYMARIQMDLPSEGVCHDKSTHPSHNSAGKGDGSANSAWRTGGCLCFPKRAPIRAALSLARSVALSCRSQSCKHGRRLACSQTMCCQVLFWDLTRQWRQANGKYT